MQGTDIYATIGQAVLSSLLGDIPSKRNESVGDSLNLENGIQGEDTMPCTKGVCDMATDRRKVIVGNDSKGKPIIKDIKGDSQDDVNVKMMLAMYESGRLFEVLPQLLSIEQQPTQISLKEYSDKWIERKRKLKPSTKANYQKYLRDYIIPVLGNLTLDEIKVEDVQKMLDTYEYLARKTLKDALGILSQILEYAVSDELIKKNPCKSRDIEIPSDRIDKRQALPIEQYREILSNLPKLKAEDRMYLGLIMYTGMRRGEALGMMWEDVDINNKQIHIRRNVNHPQTNQPVVTSPKTKAGERDIDIDESLQMLLKPMKAHGYIVSGEKPITLSAYRNMWERITRTIDMHGATPHVLRHSYLTYAVGVTNDIKTVQGISGHADYATLVNRYAHPQEDKKKAFCQAMHQRLCG